MGLKQSMDRKRAELRETEYMVFGGHAGRQPPRFCIYMRFYRACQKSKKVI